MECANEACNGYRADIVSPIGLTSDDGSEVGVCDRCGILHVKCIDCGTTSEETNGIVQCDGCDRSWSVEYDREGSDVESVTRTS